MSRYVHVAIGPRTLEQVRGGLHALGLRPEVASGRRLMLEGSLECAGEPVDVRLVAGTLGSVEDFGFVHETDAIRLVCGELDQDLLTTALLEPLRAHLAAAAVTQAAAAAGLEIESVDIDADGQQRIVLKER